MLTSLKFWALAFSLVWITVVVTIIAEDPGFAHGPR
jgi:hypothetical protein